MNKDEVLKRIRLKDDKVIVSNAIDKYIKFNKTGISTYTNFLDIRILSILENSLKYLNIDYNVYLPNENCEKSIIYFGNYEDFITIYRIKMMDVTHSDVLGTLFSLGYEISSIGDIFIEDEYIYLTNLTRLNSFLENSLYEIKNKRVNLEITDNIILTRNRYLNINIIVPSYRLDSIISKLGHFSRSGASKYIEDGNVLINYEQINNPNKIIKIGDIISIRKVGKFKLNTELTKTKKDNILIEVLKYN